MVFVLRDARLPIAVVAALGARGRARRGRREGGLAGRASGAGEQPRHGLGGARRTSLISCWSKEEKVPR